MKRIIALVLVALMVLSLNVAFADPTPTTGGEKATVGITKKYTVTTTKDELVPAETLSFTSTPATENPDGGTANITPGTITVTQNATEKTYDLEITLPSYSIAGIYHYTLYETPNTTTQGTEAADYDTTGIMISVLVEFEQVNGQNTTQLVVDTSKVGITKPEGKDKNDTLTNNYEMGDVTVTKKIEGNLADPTVPFGMTITFTKEDGKTVYTPITATGTVPDETVTVGDAYAFTLKAGDTITFKNVPKGITYTITENSDHKRKNADKLSLEEINTPSAGYTVEGEVEDQAIVVGETTSVEIKNTKETQIDTGIILQYAPYIAILAVVLAGAILMIIRRRRNNED